MSEAARAHLAHEGGASHSEAATESINGSTNYVRLRKFFAGVRRDLVLSSRMLKGALFLALGFLTVCFPVAAQEAKHSRGSQHRVAASAVRPLDEVSNLSI